MTERPTPRRPRAVSERFTQALEPRPRFLDFGAKQDLHLIAAFSLIGLLAALNLMFRFPEFGAVIAQYNQF